MRLPVTLCINTRNAAADLAACIESAPFVSEVLIADMESEDGTPELAERLGARVMHLPQAGVVEPGRQPLIDAAGQPWVLLLDADERAAPGLGAYLAERIAADDADGVLLPRQNLMFGRWNRTYWPDYQLRFFRTGRVTWPPYVHARPTTTGREIEAPKDAAIAIIHHTYPTVAAWLTVANRYTDHEVTRNLALGRRPSVWRLLTWPFVRFVQRFFLSGGWRDGRYGLVWAMLLAAYHIELEAKILEQTWNPAARPPEDEAPADPVAESRPAA